MAMIIGGISLGTLVYIVRAATVHGNLPSLVSTELGVPVKFTVVEFNWRSLHPKLVLENLRVEPGEYQFYSPLRIHRAEVVLSVWRSLLAMSPVANKVILSGLRLKLSQEKSGRYALTGVNTTPSSKGKLAPYRWADIWSWLDGQQDIEIQNMLFLIHPYAHKPIGLTHIDLHWYEGRDGRYNLTVRGRIFKVKSGRVLLEAELGGNLSRPKTVQAKFYMSVKGNDFAPLLTGLPLGGTKWQKGGGSIRLWGRWQHGLLKRLHSIVKLDKVKLRNPALESELVFPFLQENVLWQQSTPTKWQLSLERLLPSIEAAADQTSSDNISITHQINKKATTWGVRMSMARISTLAHLALIAPYVPLKLKTTLKMFHPQGELDNIYVAAIVADKKLQNLLVNASVDHLAFASFHGAPGVSGLNGHLHVTRHWGELVINSPQLKVTKGSIFAENWPAVALNADIVWRQEDQNWQVLVKSFKVANQDVMGQVQGDVILSPQHWANPKLALLSQLVVHNAERTMKIYLPKKGIDHKTYWWLTNCIVKAKTLVGTMAWRGVFDHMPYADHHGAFEAKILVKNASMRPWAKWPVVNNVNGEVWFVGPSFKSFAASGRSYGVKVSHLELSIPDITPGKPSDFFVRGHVTANGVSAQAYVENSPLDEELGQLNKILLLRGPVRLDLNLNYPLGASQKPNKIAGVFHLQGDSAGILGVGMLASDLAGQVTFDRYQLSAQGIKGNLLGRPFILRIHTHTNPKSDQSTSTIAMQGHVDATVLQQQFHYPWAYLISGDSPFAAKVVLGAEGVSLRLSSQLKGLGINLPAPFNKPATTILPLVVSAQATTGNEHWPVKLTFGNMLAGVLNFGEINNQFGLTSGQISVGTSQTPKILGNQGMLIDGDIPYLSANEWKSALMPMLSRLSEGSASASTKPISQNTVNRWFHAVSVKIGELVVGSHQFSDIVIGLAYQYPHWLITLDSKAVKGEVVLPDNWQTPLYSASFDYLYLSRKPGAKLQDKVSAKTLAALPALNVGIKYLHWGKALLGQFYLKSQPLSHGIKITSLSLDNKHINAKLQGSVAQEGNTDVVSINGDLNGKNWGNALGDLGYTGLIEQGKGLVSLQLSWRGELFDPDLATLNGYADFDLKDGSLTQVNPGFSRLLGLVSLNSLVRRLELNFTDLTEKGLAFNEIKHFFTLSKI